MQTLITLGAVLLFASFIGNMALLWLILQRFAPKKNDVDYFEILAIRRRIEELSGSFDNRISNFKTRYENMYDHLSTDIKVLEIKVETLLRVNE